MVDVSKLLLAIVAGALVVSMSDLASAKSKRRPEPAPSAKSFEWPPRRTAVVEATQTPPPRLPRQFFPEKGVQPLTPELEQALKPADSFKECDDGCPEMVVVPKGSFMMGTSVNEIDRDKGEGPIHRVSFAKPFAVGRFTISFDEWDACLADGGCGGNKGDDRGFGRGRMPAQGISFDAARSYLGWLSKKVGRTYRLPSESEREYFARAGTATPFWFGNTVTPQDANYRASTPYGSGPHGPDSKGPVVVDSYAPNPFGIYQVHGNVWEWTEDCFNKRYNEDTPVDGAPWLEGDCGKRILRGGTWEWSADVARAGARNDSYTGGSKSFRVVRTLNVPLQ